MVATAGARDAYRQAPDWVSADTPVSTGGALVDLDRDGWLDLVVANGNDMQQQTLTVYYNRGDGTFPATPDWQSADTAYNGHLSVADVNGDGWPDVAVAVLGRYSDIDYAAKLYLNNNGTLSSWPDWQANFMANAFSCAFGDVNNDGRPDLAVGTGWAYDPQNYYNNYVYLNVGGMLESSPSWQSDDTYHYQGVHWVDMDDDGWLDLVGIPNGTQTRIYRNLGGTLETTASWLSDDGANQDAIMATSGDVTNDGYRDLIVTDNTQLAGSGLFRLYPGTASGFATTYTWSDYQRYGSAVALADVNGDGLLDLAAGGWWARTRLYLNTGSGFDAAPSWYSSTNSVIEKIIFGDVDNDGLETQTVSLPADGGRLFYLPHQPIQELISVVRDGVTLTPDQYTCDREFGWISVDAAPAVSLDVTYTTSYLLDMAVTNWDNDIGNYLFYNILRCPGDLSGDGRTDLTDLSLFLTYYGCTADCGDSDFDGDGDVDLADLAILLADYGCN